MLKPAKLREQYFATAAPTARSLSLPDADEPGRVKPAYRFNIHLFSGYVKHYF